MLGKVFKAYDIRATYPTPLSPTTAWKIGFGTSRFLLQEAEAVGATDPMMRNIIVGQDMRPHSPELASALSDGLRAFGAHVIDVGLVDTSFIYFAINYLNCAGGVQTTASHNPIEYNGFKISARNALPVGQNTGLVEISKFAAMADKDKSKLKLGKPGRIESRDLWDGYREHVLSFLNLNDKTVTVVIDASNGMAGTMVPKIFDKIPGLKIIPMNFTNNKGEFVHEPNPLIAANLESLQARVLKEKADFGICFDGDADRGIFVDENAKIIPCDHLTAVLAEYFLKDNQGAAIVYDLRSSKAVEEHVLACGGKPVMSRVGHVFMKEVLRKEQGVFGGELSGHFYFRDNFNTDSGAIAFASVLTILVHTDQKFSELILPHAKYAQSGEINFENELKDEALEAMVERYGERGEVSELDGISIDCFESEGWWCNVRKSNTEPLLRLNLEATDESKCIRMLEEIAPLLGKRVAH